MDDLEERFERHDYDFENQKEELNELRLVITDVALHIDSSAPDGREKSLAVTKLEEALFWAERAVLNSDGPNA